MVHTSIVDRISPIGFSSDDGIKMCLYGRSGTGKTTLWATFPGPILAIISSGNEKPGELRSIDTPEYRKKIKQVVLNETQELKELIAYLRSSKAFKTVVLDHATGLQDQVLKEVLGLEELPAQKSWGMARREDYGVCTTQCKEYLRALLSLDANVVIVAQERGFGGGDDTMSEIIAPSVGAGLMPSLAQWLHPTCDYVCQTYIREQTETKKIKIGSGKDAKTHDKEVKTGNIEYVLRVKADPVFISKFRVPRGTELPDAIVDPTYAKIAALIRPE